MSLTSNDIKKIAHLARLSLDENQIPRYTEELTQIFGHIEQMNATDTTEIMPMAHPLDFAQPLRTDKVTEKNQRALFQSIAPQVESGLYLVPQVIE